MTLIVALSLSLAMLFVMVGTTTSTSIEDAENLVQKTGKYLQEFIRNQTLFACETAKNIHVAQLDWLDVVDKVTDEFKDEVAKSQAELSSQLKKLLSELCGPIKFLFSGSKFVTKAQDSLKSFGDVVVGFLYELIGRASESLHSAFCGEDDPGSLWKKFQRLYKLLSKRIDGLSPLLAICADKKSNKSD